MKKKIDKKKSRNNTLKNCINKNWKNFKSYDSSQEFVIKVISHHLNLLCNYKTAFNSIFVTSQHLIIIIHQTVLNLFHNIHQNLQLNFHLKNYLIHKFMIDNLCKNHQVQNSLQIGRTDKVMEVLLKGLFINVMVIALNCINCCFYKLRQFKVFFLEFFSFY